MDERRIAADALVSLDRYPLFDDMRRASIIGEARQALTARGAAILPGFLRPNAIEEMAAEAEALLSVAHRRDRMLGAYAASPEPWMAADHPMRRTSPYRMQVAATDQMDAGGPTLALYQWDPLLNLVRDILDLPVLHRVVDPLMRCNFTYLTDGDEHGWHFDGNDFVVSLLLQSAEQGGAFEFAPDIRNDHDENFDGVRAIMDGKPGLTRHLAVEPGTLALFRGRHALHRVTRVAGKRPRIITLFSFDERQDTDWGPAAQRRVFGRSAGEAPVP
ncbi:MAG: hypothetical protein OEU92_20400 [Alphaproteobacteria bacterium]|nr:hypothetical protein [Alphaproteobacteria bacterium]